jgi:hypothetical protein
MTKAIHPQGVEVVEVSSLFFEAAAAPAAAAAAEFETVVVWVTVTVWTGADAVTVCAGVVVRTVTGGAVTVSAGVVTVSAGVVTVTTTGGVVTVTGSPGTVSVAVTVTGSKLEPDPPPAPDVAVSVVVAASVVVAVLTVAAVRVPVANVPLAEPPPPQPVRRTLDSRPRTPTTTSVATADPHTTTRSVSRRSIWPGKHKPDHGRTNQARWRCLVLIRNPRSGPLSRFLVSCEPAVEFRGFDPGQVVALDCG